MVETWTLPVYMYFMIALIASFVSLEKTKGHKSMLDRMASFEYSQCEMYLGNRSNSDWRASFSPVWRSTGACCECWFGRLGNCRFQGPVRGKRHCCPSSPRTLCMIFDTSPVIPRKMKSWISSMCYVRGPLRNMALASTGPPGHVSFKFCCVFAIALPIFF